MNDSLETLLADGIIEAVLGQLKTGKEAEVWLVQHAGQVVAAKLYKERHERNFRNNVGYREGREVRNSRTRRAMEKGSKFGQAAAEEAWKSAESDSLYKLHAQGVRVPTPVLFYEGILLMEVVIDAQGHPAPRLVEAPPTTPEEALAMYVDLRAQVISMLCADLIHGDLSPYNILMGYAGPVIIDFPQTIAAARNNRAEFYFRRDLDNVREFLATYAPALYGMAGDTGEIWSAYVRRELTPDFVPSGGFREGARRGGQGKGRPDARFGGGHPRLEQRAPQVEVAPAPPKPAMTPEEAAEAELLELEALVLRQGGGERGKPPAAPAQRGGRRGPGRGPPRSGNNRPNPPASQQARPAGGGGARPPQANGARPPQGEQRNGGPRGFQGGAVNGNGEAARNGDSRNGAHRPQGGAGESRGGGPRGFQGNSGQGAGDSRGAPRGFQGERRNGNGAQGAGDSRGEPRGFQGERRNGDAAQGSGDSRGGPRGFQGERRNGDAAQGPGDSRGGPRGFSGEARGAGDSRGGGPRGFQGERRDAAAPGPGDSRGRGPRGAQGERRNGGPRDFQGEARNGQDAHASVAPAFEGGDTRGAEASRNGGPRGPGDFRNGNRRGDPSEPRNGHANSRPPMNGRGNRDERQPLVEHRGQGNEVQAGASNTFAGNDARPPRGERRGGPNRPSQPAVETRPPTGPGGNTLREARQQRPNSNRGNAPRGPRGGPQVSYVARNNNPSDSGPTETGS
ncbi:RIO1 family regulatory kinase/ATPase [Myxococcus faecalis]|uniref:RIO1 family regulatory kinase/ATPase domain-containing protein n=1 Tax=Myxococcus faecalis TaxID=3115646 RepID=UPI0038D1CE52